ncbi:MAG: FecR family protein [Bacteroidales bacterium]
MVTKNILYRFFQGATSFREEEMIRKWIECNPENKKEYEAERKLYDMMLLLSDEVSIEKGIIKPFYRQEWTKNILRIVAMIIAMLGSAGLYHSYKETKFYTDSFQTLSVPAGHQLNIRLSDGTLVYLNSNSKISYPAIFLKKDRVIKLEGEAYFEVSHNPDKPFIVETVHGKVEVLGTTFNVDAYPEENVFEVSLIEGSVKVHKDQFAYLLEPAQKMTFKNGHISISTIDDFNSYRWREGLICFQNETFRSIINQFERSYGISLEIKNKDLLEYRYTGKFRHADGILYALRVLQHDVNFEFERDEDKQTIYIR